MFKKLKAVANRIGGVFLSILFGPLLGPIIGLIKIINTFLEGFERFQNSLGPSLAFLVVGGILFIIGLPFALIGGALYFTGKGIKEGALHGIKEAIHALQPTNNNPLFFTSKYIEELPIAQRADVRSRIKKFIDLNYYYENRIPLNTKEADKYFLEDVDNARNIFSTYSQLIYRGTFNPDSESPFSHIPMEIVEDILQRSAPSLLEKSHIKEVMKKACDSIIKVYRVRISGDIEEESEETPLTFSKHSSYGS